MSTIDHSKMSTYVDGKLVKEGRKDESQMGKFYWWKASEKDMAAQIHGTVKFIQTHQSSRVEQLTASTRLYGNSQAFNFIGPALQRSAASSATANSNRISFNLCASVIDTLVSKIAKNRIIPTFITSGGIWGMQKKAEQLTKFAEGICYDQDIHFKITEQFKDGAVWGTGVLHVFDRDSKVAVERALPHEFCVDLVESMVTKPSQLHRVKIVDRDVLKQMFIDDEEAVEAIDKAMPASYIEIGGVGSAADLVTVIESWHLKSGEDATDGLHTICVDDKVLYKEKYEKDYFPFVFYHYKKRLLGFWGQGACERLQNLQGEINRLMILIQRSMWMGGSFKVLIENGSKVVSQHLNNDVGAIIHYTGTPPQYITPPMIQQDIYPYVDALIAKGYQQEGVSQLAASSLKPEGVDSGAAMRTYDQIGDDRILFTGQEVEEVCLEVIRQCVEVAKDIYKDKGSYEVVFPTTKFLETINWKDIKLKDNEYVLRAFPTSSLPDDPAGRLATIQEYAQAGYISPRTARKLMSMPDVEMSDKLANAAEDLICNILEDMLDEDIYKAPEPYNDLALAKTLALEYYNYASLNNCPEEKLELVRRFINQINDLTGVSAPPPPPMAAPQANPTATPTSNLIPNINQGVQQ